MITTENGNVWNNKMNLLLKNGNKTKGITLIVLVITIIVLLILAGVSIATITGQNGILEQANNAKIETRRGEVEDRVKLWKTEYYIGQYTDTATQEEGEFIQKLKDESLIYDN